MNKALLPCVLLGLVMAGCANSETNDDAGPATGAGGTATGGGAGRARLGEVSGVDSVHFREEVHVGEIDGDGDDVTAHVKSGKLS